MTVGLSNSWTSDLSFEISDLLIYVMTYIWGFRISVVQAAARPRLGPRLPAAGHAIQYVTGRTGVHGAIFRPIAL